MVGTQAGANGSHVGARAIGAGVVVSQIPFDRPWDWLAAGWRDLWTKPCISLAYGVLAMAAGVLSTFGLWYMQLESLIPVLAGGFLLVGPLVAVGLYEKSRQLAAGETTTLGSTIAAGWRSMARLGFLSVLLLFIYLVWVRIAFLLLALFLGTGGLPPAREFMPTLLFTPHGLGLLVVGTAVGAVLATIVFAATAISIPMLMDRPVDGFSAMQASAEAVVKNPKPMALWAILIAGFMALGLLTLGAGLIIAFPLIGHATWHAYRDIVVPG